MLRPAKIFGFCPKGDRTRLLVNETMLGHLWIGEDVNLERKNEKQETFVLTKIGCILIIRRW